MSRFASSAALLAAISAAATFAGCEAECPDDQTTAVVLRILGAPSSDITFDVAVFANDQYELPMGGAPVVDDENADYVEISDVSFVGEGVTVLVTPRCNDHCRRFLARLNFRRRGVTPEIVATSWLETGYREESFTEFRWLVPDQLLQGTGPCATCGADQTCRGRDEATFTPQCEPIEVPRCAVPPLGSGLPWTDFDEPTCSSESCR